MKQREILVFGNPLIEADSIALTVAEELKGKINGARFKEIEALCELEEVGPELTILDAVSGIEKACILGIDDLKTGNVFSLHDFDLGFELQLLRKLGKINKATIIGIPMHYDAEKAAEEAEALIGELF